MEKSKVIIKNLLLAFALISIGYAVGKNTAMRSADKSDTSTGNAKYGQHLIVYYTHATIRCETCNNIEKMTHELLMSKFKKELDDGLIEWKVVNFQENDDFAKEFDVTTSGVITVLMNGDKVEDFKRLEDVWTLLEDPSAFNDYLDKAIRNLLPNSSGDEG